jgi:L-threonylcarbamoyladenylate synthase
MAILTLELGKEEDLGLIKEIAAVIKNGGIAVIPTDTIYAIVASASNKAAVERVYKLRKRTSSKPMILMVSSKQQIIDMGIKLNERAREIMGKLWPAPLSIVVDAPDQNLNYLHRGKKTLAFRMPDNEFLKKVLEVTGPIVAPSANLEGEKPALDIEDAKKYFKDTVPLYVDAGVLQSKPSTVAKLEDSKLKVLREGAAKIPKEFLK